MKLNKNLFCLLSGQFISQLGDKFYMLALALWVLDVTKSSAMMGLIIFCSLLPSTVLGFISGAFIDKYSKKFLIVCSDVIRGTVITGIAICYALNALNMTIIITGQILLSICAAFFDPAIPAIIPLIVDKEQLSKANSKSQFIRGFVSIAGPIVGGAAVAAFGYFYIFLFNAVSYFISALFESLMLIPHVEKTAPGISSIRQKLIEGYKYIFRNINLIIILIIVCGVHFFVGLFMVLMPLVATSLNGIKAANLGYIETAFGLGTVAMSFILGIMRINKKEVSLLFSSIFFFGIIFILGGSLNFFAVKLIIPYLVLFFALSALIVIASTCFFVVLQSNVDSQISGRVFSVSLSLGGISLPVSSLLYGLLFENFNQGVILVITGVILILGNIFLTRGFRRSELGRTS